MNTSTDTVPANRQAEASLLAERILLGRRVPEPAAYKAVRNPSAAKDPSGHSAAISETFTVVEARINVGSGNALFIRGQGGGLSWEEGKALSSVDASTWIWVTDEAADKVAFKLLLNDEVWARGADSVVEAGRKIELVPWFG